MNRKNQVHSDEGVAPEKRLEFEKLLAKVSFYEITIKALKAGKPQI